MSSSLLDQLRGGDRRSIGRSEDVAHQVLGSPELFGVLVDGMCHDDPLIRMRAADAVEKVSNEHPEWLAPHKRRLLSEVAAIPQQEVRWHLAQLIPRLDLTRAEEEHAIRLLLSFLNDESRIVKTFSMQAMADLAAHAPRLRPKVIPTLERLTETGSAAMRSRGRRLLAQLEAGADEGDRQLTRTIKRSGARRK